LHEERSNNKKRPKRKNKEMKGRDVLVNKKRIDNHSVVMSFVGTILPRMYIHSPLAEVSSYY
jgi:hypothetical protein